MKTILGADVILRKGGKVLLVQQRKQHADGLWSFPGGHVEEGETLEQAIRREVQEELGVTLTHIEPFQGNTLKTEAGHDLELHSYLGDIKGEISLRNEELMAYGWFSLASLEEMQNKLRNPIVLDLARQALSSKSASISAVDELATFMQAYEKANNSHIWANVEPFIARDATYWFTDGSFNGIDEIRDAIEATFAKIQDEVYEITDVQWPIESGSVAVCTYRFSWQGIVDGQPKSGTGRGTNILERGNNSWQIVHEHLSL